MPACPLSATVSRRALLAGIGGATVLLASAAPLFGHPVADNPTFRHGVASGDPDQTSVVLWTRITGTGETLVEWEMSDTPDFARILKSGTAAADAKTDHTVKLLATDLKPGAIYYFRFRANGLTSPTGRTRTLPGGRLDRLGIALASCSNYPFGLFNAYDAIARDADIEFVLHTGDYIYEYGADGWGAETGRKLGREHRPAHEIVSLADYRERHAQYKTDPGLQAMHAAHPLLACWDDHESTNNPWTGGAQNHQPEKEGDWNARRAASIRAYFEWMPVREPEWLAIKGRKRKQFWRSYSFGDLATLCTIETRHTARARQIDYLDWSKRIHSQEDADRLRQEEMGKPGRRMLSREQEKDLSAALTRSVKAGQPWRLIGNPMPIARTNVPDVVGLGILPDPAANTDAPFPAKVLAWKGKWNLPFYPDTWDGYPWAREQFYSLSRKAGAGDLVFLTGDSHSFWANRLSDDDGRPAGIEIGTAGISSPGDFIESGFGPDIARQLDRAFAEHIDEIVWTDNMHQGYVRVELTRERGEATCIGIDTLASPHYRTASVKRLKFGPVSGSVDFL